MSCLRRCLTYFVTTAYLMCAFAAFAGISFGYDLGYIKGILGMDYCIHTITGLDTDITPSDQYVIPSWEMSLMTSIQSAGTSYDAFIDADLADGFVIVRPSSGTAVSSALWTFKTVSTGLGFMVAGRLVADFGAGLKFWPSSSSACLRSLHTRCQSSLATNSASPLVSSSPLASLRPLTTGSTPPPTGSPSASNFCGPSSVPSVSSFCLSLLVFFAWAL